MKQRKRAGHLSNASLSNMFSTCLVALGHLAEDTRETDHRGYSRDFSNKPIRTSWVERLEYNEATDTTIIFTRNSIYFSVGNLLKSQLGLDEPYAEGKDELLEAYQRNSNLKEHTLSPNAVYQLTANGYKMTGEGLGEYIMINDAFSNHNLCGDTEVPFSLLRNRDSQNIQDVFFLNNTMFERASLPLKLDLEKKDA